MSDTVVIVVSFDAGPRLQGCLRSVQEQEPAPRVLVVDNASRDGSVDVLPPGVQLLRRRDNAGFGAAVQDGLEATSEPFVLTLNPDTLLLPGCLAAATAILRSAPTAAAVAPVVLQAADPTRIDACGIGLTSTFGAINRLHGLPAAELEPRSEEVLGPLGGAALWRREALLRVGGFERRYFLYWEDVDLALRLSRAGWTCLTAPAAHVLHEGSATVGRWSKTNVFYMVRNHGPCLLATLPKRIVTRRLPALLLAPVRAAILYALRGRPWAAGKGLLCSLRLLPGSFVRRRALPALGDEDAAASRLTALLAAADHDRRRMKNGRPPA